MSNPARPVTDTPIDTAWGLAVADTVVRTYPNAASRDADLGLISPAELLGQVVVLTDTGALLVYAGPVMGWRPPWAMPWGVMTPTPVSSTLAVTGTASFQTILSTVPTVTLLAGRTYRIDAVGTVTCSSPGQLNIKLGASNYAGRVLPFSPGEFSMRVVALVAQLTTAATVVDLGIVGVGTNAAGSMGTHRLVVEDIGPAANPTALVADEETGELTVDVEALDPELRAVWDAMAPDSVDEPADELVSS